MNNHMSRKEWETLLDEQSKSGLSKKKFCQEKGITPAKFYYYQNLLSLKNEDQQVKEETPALAGSLIPIQIKKDMPEYQIKLILKNGLECILPGSIDKVGLKEIIEVLRHVNT